MREAMIQTNLAKPKVVPGKMLMKPGESSAKRRGQQALCKMVVPGAPWDLSELPR